jgi:hypothetical protein
MDRARPARELQDTDAIAPAPRDAGPQVVLRAEQNWAAGYPC